MADELYSSITISTTVIERQYETKKYCNKFRNTPTEILLNNFLDKEFQNMLLPLNIMQTMFLLPKFRILYNFVTPNQKFVALIGLIFYMSCYVLRFYVSKETHRGFFSFMDLVFYAIGFLINCLFTITQSNSNINLIMILSKIYYQLTIKVKLLNYAVWNWIYFISIFILYLLNASYFFLIYSSIYMFFQCTCMFILMCIDINAIYAIRILDLLKTELKIWTIEVESLDAKMIEFKNREISNYWNKTFEIYVNIQEAFQIYKKVCQTQILFIIGESFFHSLLYLSSALANGNRLQTMQSPFIIILFIGVSVFVLKNIVMQSLLSREYEQFYLGMNKAEYICARMLTQKGCTGAKRIMCKNIRRLNKSLDFKFNVLGFFDIDAKFPLNFMSVLATYVIVLLQFEFNK